ncbi:LuxR C-terminal-related transcriptional regulator [Moorena sp. SIO4G3]|uniref:response regulator transcription factor n=1 Tax=Moorena sp. SIO4G3 TaxID=2607821 RepID=UPI00142BCE4B|nr:LuxR C-terminal-related transcriptional regulator [Moorena sp. SIO4G3]NEO76082.1 response regulator transcription factor [Moorena sp. SIO4G3]
MKEKLNFPLYRQDIASKDLESELGNQVIGKLFINNSCFLVFETNNEFKPSLGSSSNSPPESSCPLNAVGYLEVNGKVYAITEFQDNTTSATSHLASLLTERELQIVTLVASGQSNKLIAKHLEISEWTVSAHLRRIFLKLDVDSRAAMVYQCAPLIQQLEMN